MSEKTIKDFIPDLPEHCGHRYRPGKLIFALYAARNFQRKKRSEMDTYAIGFIALYTKS